MRILQKALLDSQPLSLLWFTLTPLVSQTGLLFEGLSREGVSIWKARILRL